MCVRNEWFEATPAETLFAVYTAALPWMAKLPTLRPLEPEIVRPPVAVPAPQGRSSLGAAEALGRLRRQHVSPMDPCRCSGSGHEHPDPLAYHYGCGWTDWLGHMAISAAVHALIYSLIFRVMHELTFGQRVALAVVKLAVLLIWARPRGRPG